MAIFVKKLDIDNNRVKNYNTFFVIFHLLHI